MNIPKSHPRYLSLKMRQLIVAGVKEGITSVDGLIAHGRGEAFDYLLSEKTHKFAKKSIKTAAALLLTAKHPVISVNGNTAALVAKELVLLAKLIQAPLEVNIFHQSKKREENIKKYLLKHGANKVLLPEKTSTIAYLESNRKFVNKDGILKADVVFVPLEDGDRAEALIKNGKKVITVDLNPLSRTARQSTVTIVDNVVRGLPFLILQIKKLQDRPKDVLAKYTEEYNNKVVLDEALREIVKMKE